MIVKKTLVVLLFVVSSVAQSRTASAGDAPTASAAQPRTITIFQQRQIAIPVPDGWTFADSRDDKTGVQTVTLKDRSGEIELSVSFFPDQANRLSTKAGLEKQMRTLFAEYVAGSVEGKMNLTFRETADGIMGHAVFTDRELAGHEIPKDQRLNSTTGLRSWSGVYAFFTLLSNQTKSDAYATALELVRSGMQEEKARAR